MYFFRDAPSCSFALHNDVKEFSHSSVFKCIKQPLKQDSEGKKGNVSCYFLLPSSLILFGRSPCADTVTCSNHIPPSRLEWALARFFHCHSLLFQAYFIFLISTTFLRGEDILLPVTFKKTVLLTSSSRFKSALSSELSRLDPLETLANVL